MRPWTIYQRFGQLVCIPAGCPHQVSSGTHDDDNLTVIIGQVRNVQSAVKIACDFVSLQTLDRTFQLLSEQREHRLKGGGNHDVLQIRALLWYAWKSVVTNPGMRDEVHNDGKFVLSCRAAMDILKGLSHRN